LMRNTCKVQHAVRVRGHDIDSAITKVATDQWRFAAGRSATRSARALADDAMTRRKQRGGERTTEIPRRSCHQTLHAAAASFPPTAAGWCAYAGEK
jgi:hypothetical protein